MDAEDRRILVETARAAAATSQKVDDLILWSKEVHQKRDEELKTVCEKVEEHGFYIRLLKWVIAPLTPMSIIGLLMAIFQWIKAHANP